MRVSVSKAKKRASQLHLRGQIAALWGKSPDRPKRMRLVGSDAERELKLSKAIRGWAGANLQTGDWVEVIGMQQYNPKKDCWKCRAEVIRPLGQATAPSPATAEASAARANQPAKRSGKSASPAVLVCQKSSCCKRGARDVYQAVTAALQQQGLDEEVEVRATGCMSKCKQGPCIAFKPDKARYLGVTPERIPALVEQHFAPSEAQAELAAEQAAPQA